MRCPSGRDSSRPAVRAPISKSRFATVSRSCSAARISSIAPACSAAIVLPVRLGAFAAHEHAPVRAARPSAGWPASRPSRRTAAARRSGPPSRPARSPAPGTGGCGPGRGRRGRAGRAGARASRGWPPRRPSSPRQRRPGQSPCLPSRKRRAVAIEISTRRWCQMAAGRRARSVPAGTTRRSIPAWATGTGPGWCVFAPVRGQRAPFGTNGSCGPVAHSGYLPSPEAVSLPVAAPSRAHPSQGGVAKPGISSPREAGDRPAAGAAAQDHSEVMM